MKRVFASIGATVAALVALLSFKTHAPEPAVALSTMSTTTTSGGASSTTPATASTSTSASSSTVSTKTKTVTGDSIDTRWGPVQVKITAEGTKITAIDVVDYPENNGRDQQINAYAVPELVSQALSAQSASIDGVSGATYTTDGFEQSLQSAISKL